MKNKIKLAILMGLFILSGGILLPGSVYAETSISISSTGNISFGEIQPGSASDMATAQDNLDIITSCAAGVNIYISAVKDSDSGTNLINNTATSDNTISTVSGTTVGDDDTAVDLENNTWGFNKTENSSSYYGLPDYSSEVSNPLYTNVAGDSTVPVYFAAKVNNTIVPGTYTGNVLYTAMVDSSCTRYIVEFNKNSDEATGTMDSQTVPTSTAAPLSANAFSRTGYTFLGWSTDPFATTPTYTDEQPVTDIAPAGSSVTLYAIWAKTMQNIDVATLPMGETTTLADARDSQGYTVYRWPLTGTAGTDYPTSMAGYAIMTKDLSLGYTTGDSITEGEDLVLTADDSASAGTITARTGTSDWNSTNSDDNLQYINGPKPDYEDYSSHSYYSYDAAQKVCPKGWRIPTNDEYNSIVTFMKNGGNGAAGSTAIRNTPYNFVYGGLFSSGDWSFVSSYGNYWASTQKSNSEGHALIFDASNLYTEYDMKYAGFSVRCIAEAPNHNVTINSGSNISSITGAGKYSVGETVPISATTNTGYHFTSWTVNSGDANLESTSSASTSFTMPDADVTITANGAANTYTINYSAGSTGGSCSGSTSATYDQDVTLASSGCSKSGYYYLRGWSTSSSGSSKTYNLGQTLTTPNLTSEDGGSYTLYPYFEYEEPTYRLTVSNGYLGSSGTSTSGYYAAGSTVTIRASSPGSYYSFSYWSSSNGGSFSSQYSTTTTFTMPSNNVTVTANYSYNPPKYYTLNITDGYIGTSGTSTSGSYTAGSTVTVRANPPVDHHFTSWSSHGGGTFADSLSSTTTFTMPSEDVLISANWEIDKYTVYIEDTASPFTSSSTYAIDSIVTITAPSHPDLEFSGWTSSAGVRFNDASSITTTFRMPPRNVTVVAHWKGF